jgi:hypothetical protein
MALLLVNRSGGARSFQPVVTTHGRCRGAFREQILVEGNATMPSVGVERQRGGMVLNDPLRLGMARNAYYLGITAEFLLRLNCCPAVSRLKSGQWVETG